MESMSLILTNDQWDFALSELIRYFFFILYNHLLFYLCQFFFFLRSSFFYRVTKPGGYIELAEFTINFKNDGPIFHKVTEGRKCCFNFNFVIILKKNY